MLGTGFNQLGGLAHHILGIWILGIDIGELVAYEVLPLILCYCCVAEYTSFLYLTHLVISLANIKSVSCRKSSVMSASA